jgi:hypothetical protein
MYITTIGVVDRHELAIHGRSLASRFASKTSFFGTPRCVMSIESHSGTREPLDNTDRLVTVSHETASSTGESSP